MYVIYYIKNRIAGQKNVSEIHLYIILKKSNIFLKHKTQAVESH